MRSQTEFNMPPGVSARDIPGWDDDSPVYPDVRCHVCGCFVAYGNSRTMSKNFVSETMLKRTYHCPGGEDAMCDDWASEHEPHQFEEYDGILIYYRCARCGATVEFHEF